jgi:putative heme iron utilization protein
MIEPNKTVLGAITPEVIAAAQALIREADHAALATLEPATGDPLATRVGLATLADGTPVIIASALTPHSAALMADARCSLLIGVVGKGDPLAHPRVMLKCRGEMIKPGSDLAAEARARYLAKHTKSAIYIDLPDFRFFRLQLLGARFNAGFGRAYEIEATSLVNAPRGSTGSP